MIVRWFAFACLVLMCLAASAQIRPVAAVSVAMDPTQCRPHVLRKPVLSGMAVRGELSGFDPCHPSVSLTVPAGVEKPPLVISVHGGGGRPDAQAITHAFAESGMATLIFDAYKHNSVPPRSGNAYRQMMIHKVALEAYQWALTRQDIDPRRIFLYGISNGASVVLNLAAELDAAHVKGVFSEAPTPVGIGYPWTLRVPVMIAFGREDDLGARLGQKRWMIADPCRFTIQLSSAPPGTAQNCSDAQPQGRMLTTLEWAEKVRLEPSASLDIQYFEGVAHGAFLGPLTLQTAQQFAASRGFQMPADIGWSEGGTPEGQRALLAAALRFFGIQPAGPQ